MQINKPLKLEGTENLRELGGYETKDGKMTRNKVYLRSDSTNNLSEKDTKFLLEYGVTMVIDLRSTIEVKENPSPFANMENIKYENISMLDGFQSMIAGRGMPKSMFEVYKNLLDDGKEDFFKIFKLILNNGGIVLFNCTAGKDRTGVLAMLILELAKVKDEIIIQDYSESEKNLVNFIKKQKEFFHKIGEIKIPEYFLGSKREDMEKTLEYLHENYTNGREYLKKIGLSEEELNTLNKRFVE